MLTPHRQAPAMLACMNPVYSLGCVFAMAWEQTDSLVWRCVGCGVVGFPCMVRGSYCIVRCGGVHIASVVAVGT